MLTDLITKYLSENGFWNVYITDFNREKSEITFSHADNKTMENFKINIWDILEFHLESNN